MFGTDGIRARANEYPITPEVVLRVGQAFGVILNDRQARSNTVKRHKVLIGKDTRLSGYMIEMALASGLNSVGLDVLLVGPLSTPGIAFLAHSMRADAGAIISASHNPYYDNGIKFFDADGFKISRKLEEKIEKLVKEGCSSKVVVGDKIGRTKRIDDASGRYIVSVKNTFPSNLSLDGISLVLDCANGACYKVGPRIFEELGAKVKVINNNPDGFNINDNCGALYTDDLVKSVTGLSYDIGISLDGDGDRVIMCDEAGGILNGDHIMAICALDAKKKNKLVDNTIVATDMSSFGFRKFLSEHGIDVVSVDVGDKYVIAELQKRKLTLGGEQSGHIIFLDNSTTGDGLVAALKVLAIMVSQRVKLSTLRNLIYETPQKLTNLKVTNKVPLEGVSGYTDFISKVEKDLGNEGRVFIRYSGTEPILRVLVEASSETKVSEVTNRICEFLKGCNL